MLGNFGVYFEGKFYGFETKEQMDAFIERITKEMQQGLRKSVQIY